MKASTPKTSTLPENLTLPNHKNYRHPDGFGVWLNAIIDKKKSRRGLAIINLDVRKDFLSVAGRVHGGVIAAFFDHLCGAAAISIIGPNDFCSTVELKVNYFYPIGVGDKLTGKAEVLFEGKRLCAVRALLYKRGLKKPVGMCSATFNIVRAPAT